MMCKGSWPKLGMAWFISLLIPVGTLNRAKPHSGAAPDIIVLDEKSGGVLCGFMRYYAVFGRDYSYILGLSCCYLG